MSDVAAPALPASLAMNYSFVAAFAFMTWETLLSLGHEANFIWSARHMSPAKFPFLILRWYTLGVLFILQASVTGVGFDTRFFRPPYCHAWLTFQVVSLQIVVSLQQYLMALRVFALYNRDGTLIWTLGALLVLVQLGIAVSNFTIIPHMVFRKDGCDPIELPHPVAGYVTCVLLYDLLLLALTLYKAVRVWRAGGRVPLLSLVVRDGVLAFLAVLTVFALNSTVFGALAAPPNSIAWPWQFAVSAAAACRAVLQMQAVGGAPVRELMHTTNIDLALTTFTAEPECDAEQVRRRLSRWDESSLYD